MIRILRTGTLLSLTFWPSFAQSVPQPSFEAASVRPASQLKGGDQQVGMSGGPGTANPGQFRASGASIWTLILLAYHISQYQVVGPEWLKSSRFDVLAKVPGKATSEEFNMMFQNLLVERFKLTSHRERRELPVYNLVVAKGGPKLKKVVDDPQAKNDDTALPAASAPAKYTLGDDGYPALRPEPGATSGTAMADNGRVTDWMGKLTMEQFATIMSSRTGRPVTNRTGLQGRYDITIRFLFNLGRAANGVQELADPQDPFDCYAVPTRSSARHGEGHD
jgi:uncharacterized protein (TIGR03435 family)